jgi:hypothetical protein
VLADQDGGHRCHPDDQGEEADRLEEAGPSFSVGALEVFDGEEEWDQSDRGCAV